MKNINQHIGYNHKWAKEVGREEFLKQMDEKHPSFDHKEAADQIFGEETKPKAEKKK